MHPVAANRRTAVALVGLFLGMVGLAYASVPLYELFCRATGFGGTPQIVDTASSQAIDRPITVRFNAEVNGIDWRFEPVRREILLNLGESSIAHYRAVNISTKPIVGTATFNVTPLKIGQYFNKLECFCFSEQLLMPGQSMDMPVEFFVDPELAHDASTRDVTRITLSYTFFAASEPETETSTQTGDRRIQ